MSRKLYKTQYQALRYHSSNKRRESRFRERVDEGSNAAIIGATNTITTNKVN